MKIQLMFYCYDCPPRGNELVKFPDAWELFHHMAKVHYGLKPKQELSQI